MSKRKTARKPKAQAKAKAETKPDPAGRVPAHPDEPWAELPADWRDEFLRAYGYLDRMGDHDGLLRAFCDHFLPTMNVGVLEAQIETGIARIECPQPLLALGLNLSLPRQPSPQKTYSRLWRLANALRTRLNLKAVLPADARDPLIGLTQLDNWCEEAKAELSKPGVIEMGGGVARPAGGAVPQEGNGKDAVAGDLPELEETDRNILRALDRAGTALKCIDLARNTAVGKDRGTVAARLHSLHDKGMVSWPVGTRRGATITAKGRKYLQRNDGSAPH